MDRKKRVSEKLVFKDNQWQIERTESTYPNENRMPTEEIAKEVTYVPISEKGLVKNIEFEVIITRTGVTDALEHVTICQIQKFRVEIPETKAFEHWFVSLSNGKPYLHRLHWGMTEPIGFDSEFMVKLGKPKKIEPEIALELLKAKKVYPNLLKEYEGRLVEVA